MITITDSITGHDETMETYEVADTLLDTWYPEATGDVIQAVNDLENALATGQPTAELEAYLAIRITRR